MHLNLDELVRTKGDWSFSLEMGGKTYSTREIREEEFRVLHGMLSEGKTDEAARCIGSFFVEAPADVAAWDTMRLTAVVSALAAYVKDRLKRFAGQVESHVQELGNAESRR